MSDKKKQQDRQTKLTLNTRECELVAAAWLSTQNPQIDWDKFADLAGFKNAHSARTCFGPLKKKLHEQYGNGKTGGVVSPYKWKPRTKKKKADELDDEEGSADKNGVSSVAEGSSSSGAAANAAAAGSAGGPPAKKARTTATATAASDTVDAIGEDDVV